MSHPHHLHAQAALWSLTNAYRHLRTALRAATAAAAEDADRGTLRAWRPTVGRSSGTAAGLAVIVDRPAGTTGAALHYRRLVDRANEAVDQARWLCLNAAGTVPRRTPDLADAIRQVDPRTARDIHRWLTPADTAIRKSLGLLPDLWPLPTNPACPACHVRMLRVQVSAPDTTAWTVACTAGCRCQGQDCPCAMPVREEGVPHIWDRTSKLVARELARIPRRRTRAA